MNTKLTHFLLSKTSHPGRSWQYILVLALISPLFLWGQQSSIPCNTKTPWVPPTFTLAEEHTSTDLSCWEGDGGLLCSGPNVPANVVNTSLSDFARGVIAVSGDLTLSVTDNTNVYSAGDFAGFLISSGLLSAGLFGSITINTYLDNSPQETYQAIDLITLNSNVLTNPIEVGFVTTMDFDEIEINISNLLGLGAYDVHYALVERFCQVDTLDCNTPTAMNNPGFPTLIDYANTGSSDVLEGNVDNPEGAISASTSDFASLINLVGVAGSTFIAVADQVSDYPSGTFVGFDIENVTLVGAGLLNYLTITSYLDGVQQEEISGLDLLIGANAINGGGRQTVGFVTTTDVDEVKLSVNQTLELDLGATLVYNAVFEEFCEGLELPCNMVTVISNPGYPVFIDGENTGITGAVCALCDVIDAGNVINDDLSDFAQIDITAGSLAAGSIAVKNQLNTYPAGTFAGFHIENVSLVGADIFNGITVSTFNDGVFQESQTSSNPLITVGTDLLVNEGEQIVGFVTTMPFDEVIISLSNLVSFDIGTTIIYDVVLERFCPGEVLCDTTYYLNTIDFPVYIDNALTGLDELSCVSCEVEDPQDVISVSNTDFASITITAAALVTGSIAVRDALFTYPMGTFAGFTIDAINNPLQADLFGSLTISTYLDGELQEFKTAGELINLNVLIIFINPDPGVYNVGFETTLPFDEIRITVGSLASVVNLVDVYSAFVDTRTSNGEELSCLAGPNAVDDVAETDEDTPVTIDVLANDTEGDHPLGIPTEVDPPIHGSVVVSDSSFIYTPDPNFVGQDSFTYAICDIAPSPICDTAVVVITVHPVPDTIDEIIHIDSVFQICADSITRFSLPVIEVSLCDSSSHGSITIEEGCLTYDPDEGFEEIDTFCLFICHPMDPTLCDTAVIMIMVTPLLPVKWLSFEVKRMGESAVLDWATELEFNHAGFIVEHSADGRSFKEIGSVSAKVDLAQVHKYSFTDINPSNGINYYRIKQYDFDGKFDYSATRSITFTKNSFDVRVWPNPASSQLYVSIQSQDEEAGQMKLINSTGQVVYSQSFETANLNSHLDLNRIQPGLYSLLIETSLNNYIEKILVVK